jgi:cysteinyl-tRNA synthetase
MSDIVYFNQLLGVSYQSLSETNFKLAVVDKDDAALSPQELSALTSTGKTIISYLSIGEAENYRGYWQNNDWTHKAPDFLLNENPLWKGNYLVKFWDPNWHAIIKNEVATIINNGYSGIYLDVVEAYHTSTATDAYTNPGSTIRQDMIDFIVEISQYAKLLNPNFQIIVNNGVDLLGATDGDPTVANTPYIHAIDGIGKEGTWSIVDAPNDFTGHELEMLKIATTAGKYVLAIDYPTNDQLQKEFVDNALVQGFIPFAGTVHLTGEIAPINYTVQSLML